MSQTYYPPGLTSSFWIVVRPEPPGQFTAQAVGLPELHATAATREEALQQIRNVLNEWITTGQLVPIEASRENPWLRGFGHRDPNDPNEQAYLEELARLKAEDLDRTLRQYEEEDRQCPNSSSTPTT